MVHPHQLHGARHRPQIGEPSQFVQPDKRLTRIALLVDRQQVSRTLQALGPEINGLQNGLLLHRDVHDLFDQLRGWLEPSVRMDRDCVDKYRMMILILTNIIGDNRESCWAFEAGNMLVLPHMYPAYEKRDSDEHLQLPSHYLLFLHSRIA